MFGPVAPPREALSTIGWADAIRSCLVLRNCMSTVFIATRYNQVENADSPRNVWILRSTWTNTSWAASSASVGFRKTRKQIARTSFEYSW